MPEPTLASQLARWRTLRSAPLILELDLSEGVSEERPAGPVPAMLARHRPVLTDMLDGLRRARTDPKVTALVAKVGGRPMGLGRIQEIREAIIRFRESGKPTVAWAESFGELSAGNLPYYLATAFETIMLQPSGDLGLTGVSARRYFLRGALDAVGVTFQVGARHEYKSAAEQLTEREYSAPARDAAQRITDSVTEQVAAAIAARGKHTAGQAAELIGSGPYLAAQALAAGLVDALGYRDEVLAFVRQRAGLPPLPSPELTDPASERARAASGVLLYLTAYQRSRELADRARRVGAPRRPCVALIHATGMIRLGRGGRGPLGTAIGSDSLCAALRSATADPHVRAIVLRVNSPGGSYAASDTIWRQVNQTKEAGKPVVVSMSDVAASGGYYISMAADAILAHPGTLTGSIGVLTAKPVLAGLMERAGVTSDTVGNGEHAGMFTPARPFTPQEWALISSWLDHVYADFTAKVAAGRKMPAEQVAKLARGRVWTGADAAANGLVDQLGGLSAAVALACRKAGLPLSSPLVSYPRFGPLDRLRPPASSEDRRAAAELTPLAGAGLLAEAWGPVWHVAARGGLAPAGPLTLPGDWSLS